MRKLWALASVVVLAVASFGLAEQVLILKGGRQLTGEVTKTKDGYEVKTKGGTVVIAADQVEKVQDIVTPASEFKQRLEQLNKQDPEGLFRLASWAQQNKLLVEARDLLEQVLKLKPEHENARLLLRLVNMSLSTQPRETPATGTVVRPPAVDGSTPRPEDLLKEDDIYRIRLVELKLSGDNVTIDFRNKVIDRFIKKMQGQDIFKDPNGENAFRSWPRPRQVKYMLDNTQRDDSEIRDDILIKSDPQVLREFKTRVWPILSKDCASVQCHGSVKGAGKLKLFGAMANDERVVYTNYYILHEWARGGKRLINLEKPEDSLVLQAGLPQNLAQPNLAHPKPTDAPAFPSQKDPNYKLVSDWINSLSRPFLPPGYRVDYKIPLLDAPAAPAKPG